MHQCLEDYDAILDLMSTSQRGASRGAFPAGALDPEHPLDGSRRRSPPPVRSSSRTRHSPPDPDNDPDDGDCYDSDGDDQDEGGDFNGHDLEEEE